MDCFLITAISLIIFLTGYAVGRRLGIREGLRQGQVLVPLELRRLSLESGRCPTCSSSNLPARQNS